MNQKKNPDNPDLINSQEALYDEGFKQKETSPSSSEEKSPNIAELKIKSKLPLWMQTPDRHNNISESFQTLAGKISALSKNNGWKTFLFTGSEQGVGVSTITLNLGLIMARIMPDRRILLADVNISNQCLSKVFKTDASHGLMDYLIGKSLFTDIVHHTYLPNLDIIPFFQKEIDILSPFNLQPFSDFMTEANRDYDFILMDSSPALNSSHTRIISSIVDGVILIAEAGRSRFEVIEELVSRLESDGANLVGNFLNKRRFVIPKWLYRYI